MPTEPEDQILENALAPKRVSGDQGSAEQHSIADQILADRYKTSKTAGTTSAFTLRFTKLLPGNSD